MRRRSFVLPLFLLLLLTTPPALAAAPSASAGGKTEIVTDDKAHAVRFLIDGKDILTVDSRGLHVNGNVAYSGVITLGGGAAPTPAAATVPPRTGAKTGIVTDEKAHAVRVFIDGKEVLTVDSGGLHVHGELAYSGIITDTGGADPATAAMVPPDAAHRKTEVVTDGKAHVVRFLIDGKNVLTVDSTGPHVQGDVVAYSEIDTGSTGEAR